MTEEENEQETVEEAVEDVEEEVEETAEEIQEEIEETTEDIQEEVEETVDEVEETIEEQRERIEEATEDARETVEEAVDDGLDSVNEGIINVLSEILDTRTRADVYVGLRKIGEANADELAEETGLYPGKVEKALDQLEDEEVVESKEVDDEVVYHAISPTEVVLNFPKVLSQRVSDFLNISVERDDEEEVEVEA